MYQVSAAFKAAVAAGNPQRIVFVFDNGTIISNEDVNVEDGVRFHDSFCSETDLTIGLTQSGEVSFGLLNDDGYYDNFTFGAFRAYIGVQLTKVSDSSAAVKRPAISLSGTSMTVTGNGATETYELCPMGKYIAPRPSIVRKVLIDVQANDQMTLFDVDMPSSTELNITYPITAGQLLRALCEQAGVAATSYTFLNSDLTLASEPSSFETSTMREVLGWIAEAAGANARFNRQGLLEMAWLTPQSAVFDEHNYTEYEPSWYTVPVIDRLHIRNQDSTAETIIGSGDNGMIIQNNPFLRQEDAAQGFSVMVSPSRVSAYANDTVTFSSTVLGGQSPSYLWQQSADNEAWTDTLYTTANLSFTASAATCANYYRVRVTNRDGSQIYSNSVKATLKEVSS